MLNLLLNHYLKRSMRSKWWEDLMTSIFEKFNTGFSLVFCPFFRNFDMSSVFKNWFLGHIWLYLVLGMAIPRKISFLEESRSRGMANLQSSGSRKMNYIPRGPRGIFEEWFNLFYLKKPYVSSNLQKTDFCPTLKWVESKR